MSALEQCALGNRRHYRLDKIAGRHFEQTAKSAGLPDGLVREIAAELLTNSESAWAAVAAALPRTFPGALLASIQAGYRGRLAQLQRWIEGTAGG